MRRARFSAAVETRTRVMWPILFGGALITVAYTFFFEAQTWRRGAGDGHADDDYLLGTSHGHRH